MELYIPMLNWFRFIYLDITYNLITKTECMFLFYPHGDRLYCCYVILHMWNSKDTSSGASEPMQLILEGGNTWSHHVPAD